jgi:hypothetical protein
VQLLPDRLDDLSQLGCRLEVGLRADNDQLGQHILRVRERGPLKQRRREHPADDEEVTTARRTEVKHASVLTISAGATATSSKQFASKAERAGAGVCRTGCAGASPTFRGVCVYGEAEPAGGGRAHIMPLLNPVRTALVCGYYDGKN